MADPCYWHGNEPDQHVVYLFNFVGRPDFTAKWVRWIMDTKYSTEVHGIDDNDDGGTLSAWYVFSALGFFPPGVHWTIPGIVKPRWPPR